MAAHVWTRVSMIPGHRRPFLRLLQAARGPLRQEVEEEELPGAPVVL